MFEHSIKVPRLYKTAAKIVERIKKEGSSVKQLVYEKKHPVSIPFYLHIYVIKLFYFF